jgi:TolB-like protein/DNA-binding winged helix-turn-helix (wHTH) protein/Tfp pilus assembly protein PilF
MYWRAWSGATILSLSMRLRANLNAPKIFRIDDLELDEGRQRVVRNGREVPLPKLSFDLLLVLAESAPNFVSNKELMARVWPGLVIADKTVSQRIKLLRDALGDNYEEPRYIAGLRGRGYSIAAPVRCIQQDNPAAVDANASLRSGNGARMPALLPALGFVAAVIFVAWWMQSGVPDQSESIPSDAADPIANGESLVTVAVLPFRDLSSDGNDEFIALGVPEIVLDQLSTLPEFSVTARSSSFKVAQKNLSVQETGARLRVRYLIDGSIQRVDSRLRVTTQLIDTTTGTQVWAERFDRDINDIFEIQDEISANVTDALRARVADVKPMPMHTQPTKNIDAYLAYLRGRALLARRTVVDADAAVQAFEQAIEIDPAFAAAYASLYDARLMAEDRRSGGATARASPALTAGAGGALASARAQNQDLIDKALMMDPQAGAAYFARAIWADDASGTREADFRKGMDLDPSNGRGITEFAEFLDRSGRPEEAGQLLERAIRIDPLSPRAYFWRTMRTFPIDTQTLEDGMIQVLEIDPDYQPALQRYAKYRWMFHGELAQAIQLIERALALDPRNPWLMHTATALYLDIGDRVAAVELIDDSDHPEITGKLLLKLYDGDTQGAGLLALEDSAFANGLYENWGVYEALRDVTLADKDYARALIYLEKRTALATNEADIKISNFRAVPAFAQMEFAAGHSDAARDLLQRCILWIDEYHIPNLSNIYALRVKASAQLLLGETDRALETLLDSFKAQDYLQWWYTLERDPLWAPLHADPRFSAIKEMVRQHVAQQAALLDELREQGFVPRRTPATAALSPAAGIGQ